MIKLPNPFKRAVEPLSVEELIDISFRRAFRKLRPLKGRDRSYVYKMEEISRVQTVTDTITSRLDKVVKSFPSVESLDPFYRDLLDVVVGVDEVKHSLGAIQWASRLIARISRNYMAKMKGSNDLKRVVSLRREALGRMASILKRVRPEVDLLRGAIPKLKDLPDVDARSPTVIIAGMPNTGKSTLLSKITTKEPEIAPYPFTTKGLIIGHAEVDNVGRVQFVDTPGLLDRPIYNRNRAELQAITALKHLKGAVIYLFDPTETCGYVLREQISLFEEVRRDFSQRVLAVINKVDLEPMYRANFLRVRLYLREVGARTIEISAEEGRGLDALLREIKSLLSEGE